MIEQLLKAHFIMWFKGRYTVDPNLEPIECRGIRVYHTDYEMWLCWKASYERVGRVTPK